MDREVNTTNRDPDSGKDLTLVILAAGLSRRFGRSKPLEPVGPHGETLPQYTVYDAMRAGFRRVVFVVHPDAAGLLGDHLGPRLPPEVEPSFVSQTAASQARHRAKPWGTGAAVLAAGGELAGPFAVANADDLYGRGAFEEAARHLRSARADGQCRHALVGFRLRETLSGAGGVSRAICQVSACGSLLGVQEVLEVRDTAQGVVGRAAATGERRILVGSELVSMNLWAFFPDVLPHLARAFERFYARHGESDAAEFLIGDAVQALVATESGRVLVLPCASRWHGITHPADREPLVRTLTRLVDEGRYPSPLPGHR
jgi:hypothetical protein